MVTVANDHTGETHAIVNSVLLVEDDPDNAAFVSAVLRSNGYEVVVAANGGQAHSAFAMRTPDFVITDVGLPGENGVEICKRFKQTDDRVPVMMLTADGSAEVRNQAAEVGANGYLTKPVEPQALLDAVQDVADEVWRSLHEEPESPAKPQVTRLTCRCGKRLKFKQKHSGKRLLCPGCGTPLIVP